MTFASKTILVTGADGFIGSHLAEALVAQGATVRAMVQYNSFNRWGWLDSSPAECRDRMEVVPADIRDQNAVREAMRDVDLVFHLAALIAIPYSYRAPSSYIDTNVAGTLNVVQAARDLGTKRVIVTSTSEVYGTARYVPIDEAHPRQPQSPYSASKIGADCIAEAYHRSFDVPVTIVRPFNTYGPRQSARAVIPTIIAQLVSGAGEIRLGDTRPTRDLLYVKDTVTGFLAAAVCDALVGEEVNLAAGTEISIGDLAGKLIAMINPAARIVEDEQRFRPDKSEVHRLVGSCQKLQGMTGWAPTWSLDEGLAETVEWFRQPGQLDDYKPHLYAV